MSFSDEDLELIKRVTGLDPYNATRVTYEPKSVAKLLSSVRSETALAVDERPYNPNSLGCDANDDGPHDPIKHGNYTFCSKCGETLKQASLLERARKAESEIGRLRKMLGVTEEMVDLACAEYRRNRGQTWTLEAAIRAALQAALQKGNSDG